MQVRPISSTKCCNHHHTIIILVIIRRCQASPSSRTTTPPMATTSPTWTGTPSLTVSCRWTNFQSTAPCQCHLRHHDSCSDRKYPTWLQPPADLGGLARRKEREGDGKQVWTKISIYLNHHHHIPIIARWQFELMSSDQASAWLVPLRGLGQQGQELDDGCRTSGNFTGCKQHNYGTHRYDYNQSSSSKSSSPSSSSSSLTSRCSPWCVALAAMRTGSNWCSWGRQQFYFK